MFTGIVTDVGEVVAVDDRDDAAPRSRIACRYDPAASIAHRRLDRLLRHLPDGGRASAATGGGTLVRRRRRGRDAARDHAPAPGRPGTRLNLERSLKIGDELGGHIVTGHVDGVAEIVVARDGPTAAWRRASPSARRRRSRASSREKGSVALDGTSLTVNTVEGDLFTVLPHPAHARGDHLGRRRRPATGSTSRST